MKRKQLWFLLAAMLMALVLAGCGSQSESAGDSTGKAAASDGDSVTEASSDQETKELTWMTYNLKLEELRDVNDSDHFSVKEAPSDSRYVVAKLVSTEGEISMDDITEANTKSLILKDSDGVQYEPGFWAVWGVEFDEEKGFSTKETQEGFNLLYLVPKTIETESLSLVSE